jgi:hypothetical protein
VTLNEYVIINAGKDIDEDFLRKFAFTELFFSIETPSEQIKEGPFIASAGVELKLQMANLDIGHMALFYTSRRDVRLSERFAGMPLIRAVEMLCDVDEVDGILIQSDSDAWFAVPKNILKKALCPIQTSDKLA